MAKISSLSKRGNKASFLRQCLLLSCMAIVGFQIGARTCGDGGAAASDSMLALLSSVERSMAAATSLSSTTTSAVSSPSTSSSNKKAVFNDVLFQNKIWLDLIWENLIEEAAAMSKAGKNPGVIMEVGMHKVKQCLQAAKAGLQAYCVEPSPKSFKRIEGSLKKEKEEVKQRIHLYNKAASNKSEGTVPFTTSGGTGDHVGDKDMWKMEKVPQEERTKPAEVVEVPQIALDDVVNEAGGTVYLIKVDTQGFEPVVFSGLTESVRNHKLKYILMEYWPRGMDLLAEKKDACVAADLLEELVAAGYSLYALGVLAHPRAPSGYYKEIANERPLDDIRANCLWYFGLEQRFPSQEYKMGYWSDVLAVAPDAKLPEPPTTRVGKLLQPQIS